MSLLSENLLYLRESLNLKQSEFGQLFDLSRDNIASYERGTEPKIYTLLKIVNHFHISIEDILTENLSEKVGSKLGSNLGSNFEYEPHNLPEHHYEELLIEKDKRMDALTEVINTQRDAIEALKKTISSIEGHTSKKNAG